MDSLINGYVGFTKKALLWLLIAAMGVLLVNAFADAIVWAEWSAFTAVIRVLIKFVEIGIFALMLVAFIKKDVKLFNIVFIIYFSYLLMTYVFGVFNGLGGFEGAHVLKVFRLICEITFFAGAITVAVLYLTDYYKGDVKYAKTINFISIILLVVQFFVFLFTMLYVFCGPKWNDESWNSIMAALLPFLYVAIFTAVYNGAADGSRVAEEAEIPAEEEKAE